jgi:hypothetical protein
MTGTLDMEITDFAPRFRQHGRMINAAIRLSKRWDSAF